MLGGTSSTSAAYQPTMGQRMAHRFVFDCPSCSAEMHVDADIRAELLAEGCVLCRAPVTPDAFTTASGVETR
jgi:hypothetical protein